MSETAGGYALAVLRDAHASLVTSAGTLILGGPPPSAATADGLAAIVSAHSPAGPASLFDCTAGKLACKRFLALARTSIWWSTPAWGVAASELPGETQFLLLELDDGTYGLLLPLIHDDKFRGTLRPPRDGSEAVILRMESGDPTVMTEECSGALLVAAGRDPFELIERGVKEAASRSGGAKHRSLKELPATVDVFGWCTWDAFYSSVSAAGVQQGLKSLVEGGAPPKFVIIDDGWQRTDVDPEYRKAAASSGCIAGGCGMGQHLEAAKQLEEEAAALLSGPDNNMDEILRAAHKIQNGKVAQDKTSSDLLKSDSSQSGLLSSIVHSWLTSAYTALRGFVSRLETGFLLSCKSFIEEAPSNSWRMRLISALATGPFKGLILRFYAEASDHTRRLLSVEANAKFSPDAGPQFPLNSSPGDLKSVVAHLKQQYGVSYVIAWHAMMGFWGGVSAGEKEMAKYNARLVTPVPSPSLLELDPAVAWVQPVLAGVSIPENPVDLHNDMHCYLAECGIDGVKVDVQSTIPLVGSRVGGGPALGAEYHASLEDSIARHFSGNIAINCMCHDTSDLYRMVDTNLARVSDDFWPLNTASHETHIANVSYNTIFMGEICLPDFDMFHSKHPKALLHATARAISGGPVYVSDRPGHHDFALLRRLVLPDGSVLRCRQPGRPTTDCLFSDVSRDGKTALKVWNVNSYSGVVGVFNIQGSSYSRALRKYHTHDTSPPALTAAVSPADVPALRGSAEMFAVYSDSRKDIELLRYEGRTAMIVAGGGGSDVLTISPVLEAGGILVAPIGLVGMLNAGGAVLSCSFSGVEVEGGSGGEGASDSFEMLPPRCTLDIKGCGSFLCFASHRPQAVLLGGQEVQFSFDGAKKALEFEVPAGSSMLKQCQIDF